MKWQSSPDYEKRFEGHHSKTSKHSDSYGNLSLKNIKVKKNLVQPRSPVKILEHIAKQQLRLSKLKN